MDPACAIRLRPACKGDETFLCELYATTRHAELTLMPWPAEWKQAFVRMQFDAQTRHYRTMHPKADHSIVMSSGAPIGRLLVDRQDSQVLIVDLTLLPEFHGRGIGTGLVSELQKEASALGQAIIGHVACGNQAEKFWRKMGFQVLPKDEMYSRLYWSGGSVNRGAT